MHGLMKGIPESELSTNENGYLDWTAYSDKFAYISIDTIKDLEKCSTYVCKYITKDLKHIPKGQQVFMCSRGLEKPILIDKNFDMVGLDNANFENEYIKVKWQD